jgi:hypothetical protein
VSGIRPLQGAGPQFGLAPRHQSQAHRVVEDGQPQQRAEIQAEAREHAGGHESEVAGERKRRQQDDRHEGRGHPLQVGLLAAQPAPQHQAEDGDQRQAGQGEHQSPAGRVVDGQVHCRRPEQRRDQGPHPQVEDA